MFALKSRELVVIGRDDFGVRTLHGAAGLQKQDAHGHIPRMAQAEMEIAVQDFMRAAEKSRRHTLHARATHGDQLLQSQQIV